MLQTLKDSLVPLGVLNEFQVAGVFVNWWDNIKYDLKTIMTNGWMPTLIPDEYIVDTFFVAERDELTGLERALDEAEAELEQTLEDSKTALGTKMKKVKKHQQRIIKELLESAIEDPNEETRKEELSAKLKTVEDTEAKIKTTKKTIKEKQTELAAKIDMKKFGVDDKKAELQKLLTQAQTELSQLPETEKKKRKALGKTIDIINDLLSKIDGQFSSIGGVISEADSKKLIFQKHNDLVKSQLTNYLEAELRSLQSATVNIFQKYYTSYSDMRKSYEGLLEKTESVLRQMKYFN